MDQKYLFEHRFFKLFIQSLNSATASKAILSATTSTATFVSQHHSFSVKQHKLGILVEAPDVKELFTTVKTNSKILGYHTFVLTQFLIMHLYRLCKILELSLAYLFVVSKKLLL